MPFRCDDELLSLLSFPSTSFVLFTSIVCNRLDEKEKCISSDEEDCIGDDDKDDDGKHGCGSGDDWDEVNGDGGVLKANRDENGDGRDDNDNVGDDSDDVGCASTLTRSTIIV